MDNMYTWWVIKDINEYIILLKGSLWYKIPGFVTLSILPYDAMFVFNFVFNYAYINIVNKLDMDQISFQLRWLKMRSYTSMRKKLTIHDTYSMQ